MHVQHRWDYEDDNELVIFCWSPYKIWWWHLGCRFNVQPFRIRNIYDSTFCASNVFHHGWATCLGFVTPLLNRRFRRKVFVTNVKRELMPFGILWRLHSMLAFSFDFAPKQTLWIHTRKNFWKGKMTAHDIPITRNTLFTDFRSSREDVPFAPKRMLQIF